MVAGWKLALLQTHGLACPGHLGAHITSLTSIVVCLIHYRDGLAGQQEALALESHGLGSMSGSDTCSLCNPVLGIEPTSPASPTLGGEFFTPEIHGKPRIRITQAASVRA